LPPVGFTWNETSICTGYHINWLWICVVANLKFTGDSCSSWKRETLIHFGWWSQGTRVNLC
jgi:hypothetical protein